MSKYRIDDNKIFLPSYFRIIDKHMEVQFKIDATFDLSEIPKEMDEEIIQKILRSTDCFSIEIQEPIVEVTFEKERGWFSRLFYWFKKVVPIF